MPRSARCLCGIAKRVGATPACGDDGETWVPCSAGWYFCDDGDIRLVAGGHGELACCGAILLRDAKHDGPRLAGCARRGPRRSRSFWNRGRISVRPAVPGIPLA